MGWSPEKSHKMFGKANFFWSRNTDMGPQEWRLGDARWELLHPASAEARAGSRFSISQKQTLVSNAGVVLQGVFLLWCPGRAHPVLPFGHNGVGLPLQMHGRTKKRSVPSAEGTRAGPAWPPPLCCIVIGLVDLATAAG